MEASCTTAFAAAADPNRHAEFAKPFAFDRLLDENFDFLTDENTDRIKG